jgi:anti-sigma regulatory factor (Ser/Thr protein kinase)
LEYQKAYLAVNAMFAWQENNNHLWLFEGPGAKKLIKIENREKERWIDIGSYEINRIHRMIFWESEYWVGTNKGFLRLKNNNIRFIDSLEKEKTGEVFDFLIDRKNRLWMATETGLFYFDKENMFTVPKSISQLGNYCKSITEDDQGIIWCATWDGIFSYDGIQKITYSTSAGISAKKTNVVLFDSVKKELLIGNINGLDVFPIKQKELFKINKPVFIEANINDSTNKKIFTGIVLDPQQNDLKFYLSIPFFNREVPITYAYKLDDGVWNSSTNPEIILKNITSGYHVFYAKARINETWITESTTKFVFTIKTPFYKTWWFIAAMVILGQLILFFIINHFNRKAKEKKINLMQKDAEFAALKQKAFTALLNPHFIFNALNSIQFYINKNDRQNANKYLSDFASLIRKNFDAAQDAFINLEDELDNLRLYLQLEQMRFTNKFNYSFIVAEEVQTEDWMIPSMVLQPLLENAILHGLMPLQKAGNLYIRIEEKNKKLQIIIEDDGIGIEKSKALKSGGKHKSKGMQLIRERLMILAKITKEPLLFTIANASETKETKGTTITLSLPPDLFMEFEKHSAALKEL